MKTPTNPLLFAIGCSLAVAFSAAHQAQAVSFATNSAMITARYDHTATLLSDGRLLVAGGYNDTNLSSAELRDTTGKWATTGSMTTNRVNHTATLLFNGKVLVAGGYANEAPYYLSTAELYDPATGTWTNTGSLNIPHAVAEVIQRAPKLPKEKLIIVNLSGRGDKDVSQAAAKIGLEMPC